MEAYPPHYVAHNLPFVALLGLETGKNLEEQTRPDPDLVHGLQENCYTYTIDLPPISGDLAASLGQAFSDLDARHASWNSRPGPGKMGSVGFTYKNSGRTLSLPSHKAPPPPASEVEDLPSSFQLVLHSPISPLTPTSPLYPDGILTPSWMAKHQSLLPTAIICFFPFTVDATRSSLEDNALKSEINRMRSWFAETRYSTRLVVVLACDEPAPVSTVVERLGNIRRATNLDTKTLLYMPGGLSTDEARAFVGSLLSNIHATCIEYYRDLSKHARRKKNRGSTPAPTVPPTSGTSHVLSARGWNLRYETKLGVFAEFRGEMDAAERNYEQAYEDLMDGDIFAGISNWSPRFNEARLLADTLAIRILRCLLWTNQTTSAAQSWSNHKYRMQDLIDKKGKGTSTYGWQAWEATWSQVMAEIIEKVQLPFFFVPDPTDEAPLVSANIHAPPERAISRESALSPSDHLHHPGYWYEQAANKLRNRRALATTLPPEDRRAPGESPASTLASRAHIYDTYMVPEPHQEYLEAVKAKGAHSTLLLKSTRQAEIHAQTRHLMRAVARLRLETMQELIRQDEWSAASSLAKLIMIDNLWRSEGWWHLLGDAYSHAYQCFLKTEETDHLLSTAWQLQSSLLPLPDASRPDLKELLNGVEAEEKIVVELESSSSVPCLLTKFTFGSNDSCVGDPLHAQLTIETCLHTSATQLPLSSLSINFKGSIGQVTIKHQDAIANEGDVWQRLQVVELEQIPHEGGDEEKAPSFVGVADLTVSPGVSQIYQFSVAPREAQELLAHSLEVKIDAEAYSIKITETLTEPVRRPHWWYYDGTDLKKDYLDLQRKCSVDVKPRPPKMQMTFENLRETYYTDETSHLSLTLENEEAEPADVRLKVHVFHGAISADIKWSDQEDGHALVSEAGSTLPQRDVGAIEASSSRAFGLTIARLSEMGKITFEVEAVYTLVGDPNTIITKSVSQELSFVRPFESNFETSIGIHPDPWPSYFDLSSEAGLVQRSYVTAKILAYTSEPVVVEDIELMQTEPFEETVTCQIESDRPRDAGPVTLMPQELRNCMFTVDARKKDIENRQHVDLQFCLVIKWRRQDDGDASASPSNSTVLPGSLVRLDFAKPRALASARCTSLRYGPSGIPGTPIVHMTYTIENPSDYMLQFNVVMDATEQFAFAGPKMSTMQLTPFSRAQAKFTLLPLQRGVWIAPPVRITDIGFGEVLRVHAAEGIRSEKGRCLVWIPDDDEKVGDERK